MIGISTVILLPTMIGVPTVIPVLMFGIFAFALGVEFDYGVIL